MTAAVMSGIGMAAGVIGAGIAGYSAYAQGQSAQRMAAYNAQVAQQEAVMQQYQAVAASRAAQNQAAAAENQAAWAMYNRSVELRNEQASRNAATEARWTGEEAMRRQRQEAANQLAAIRAAQGSSGIAPSGSALAVLGESEANLALDALDIGRQAGDKAMDLYDEAAAHKAQAQSLLADAAMAGFNAKLARRESKVALITGRFQVAQTLAGARMGLASGRASAQAGTLGAAAYAFQGAGSAADWGYRYSQDIRTTKESTWGTMH